MRGKSGDVPCLVDKPATILTFLMCVQERRVRCTTTYVFFFFFFCFFFLFDFVLQNIPQKKVGTIFVDPYTSAIDLLNA